MDSMKNAFEFTTQINGIHLHIRASRSAPLEHEQVYQPAHLHYAWEAHYIYEGSVLLRLAEQENAITLRNGQLCLIPANAVHSIRSEDVTRFCFKMQFEFQTGAPQSELSEYLRFHNTLTSLRQIRILDDRHLSALMEQFRALSTEDYPYTHQQRGLLLTNAILRVCDLLQSRSEDPSKRSKSGETRHHLNRKWIIEEHIEGDYNSESISALAQKLYLSERQTRVVVQELMGENFKKLITKRRMEIANLLLTSQTTLSDIAYQIGYRSYNGFYTAYTNYYGLSPEEARRKLLREKTEPDLLTKKVEAKLPETPNPQKTI